MIAALTGRRLTFWRRSFLRKFCRLVLPPSDSGLPSPEEADTVAAIESYVGTLQPAIRLGLMGLVDIVNFQAIFFGYFVPMAWLSDPRATRYLERLENSRIYSVRNGFAGLKALVMTVYYATPAVETKTGYQDDCLEAG